MTKEEFIEKARKVHGEKFDYSKVELTRVKDKVIIVCPKHGEFTQEANSHLQGRGCAYCSGRKFHLGDYIEKANKVWNGKYDYSKFEWKGMNTPVCIICPEHGEFWQLPNNHLKGECGCLECLGKPKDFEKISSLEVLKKKSIEKFGNKFDFSKSEWKGSREKICIICPEHGEFWTLPRQFILNKMGCPKCNKLLRYTQEEFINICKKNHKTNYDYSETVYTKSTDKITVICPKHGAFRMRASVFKSGRGCQECASENKKLTTEEFIYRSKIVHGDKYNYDKTKYIDSIRKVIVTCPKHGDFECLPHVHLKGCDCPKCALENKVPSLGEVLIENTLKEYNIPYKTQFELTLPDIARNSNKIVVDFFVKYKGKQYFIEYNGKQHYEYIPFFFPTVEDFNKQVRRDESLREFCQEHSDKVTLIEIKYDLSDEEIKDIIKSKILDIL